MSGKLIQGFVETNHEPDLGPEPSDSDQGTLEISRLEHLR